MTDANFATLTEGESSNVVSSRVVDLLKTAEEKAKTLLEKDMVVFYGLTGEGKSTIIDYLMGYTLEKIENGPNIGKYEIKAG